MNGKLPAVSIITALYNCLELTKAYLASLERTLEPLSVEYEIVLIDDGSTDGTREFLATLSTPYQIILNEKNLGYAGANNRGASMAHHDILLFLNNDLILKPGWLEPLLKGLSNLPEVGIVGNIQLDAASGLIDHAGVFFDHKGLPAHARKGRKTIPKEEFREWNALTAACMALRKEDFLSLGGFDEAYRNGTEDIDLCVRMKKAGYRLFVANHSVVLHHVSSSPGRTDHDSANMALFQSRWGAVTADWGKREWAEEYLRRYARKWWRYNFTKFWKALFILLFKSRIAGTSSFKKSLKS